jgi:hypothetical protein
MPAFRDNPEAERQFAEIRLRACIRIGEISRELEIKAGRLNNSSERSEELSKSKSLAIAGIALSTAHDCEQLAGGREEQGESGKGCRPMGRN